MNKSYPTYITSLQHNQPFGMLLEGRNWAAGSEYKYGFNTQEQDDEVYGNGNLNTALFWAYDTRLGRRWNIDEKIKPFISGYNCFSNNPIIRVDPKGNDDYFDLKGNYLGTDKNGHQIRIVKDTEISIFIFSDIDSKTIDPATIRSWCYLGDFRYSPRDLENNIRLAKIAKHYTGELIYPVENENPNKLASESNNIIRIYTNNGFIDECWNDYHIFKSVINDHEKMHRKDASPMTYEQHANIYINQIGGASFRLIDDKDFQKGVIASGVEYAINSAIKENTMSKAAWQNKFNKSLKENGINFSIYITPGNSFKSISYEITDLDTTLKNTYFSKNKVDPY